MGKHKRDQTVAALYARVSTAEQDNSVETQQVALQRYCEWRGLQVHALYTDVDVSGGKELRDRPGGAALIDALDDAGAVVAMRVDRLFRNASDALSTAEVWRNHGIALHVVDLGGQAVNTATAAGWLCYAMLAVSAQYERLVISERVRAGHEHLRQAGRVYCRDVYGYHEQDGLLVRDDREQAVLELMRALRAQGATLVEIASTLNASKARTKRGGRWHASTVRQMLERSSPN